MTWIVKCGDWYLWEGCWFADQGSAERFEDREEAYRQRNLARLDNYPTARVVKLVPKTPDYWLRFSGTGAFLSKNIDRETGAYKTTISPRVNGLRLALEEAQDAAEAWNETCDVKLEVVPCLKQW